MHILHVFKNYLPIFGGVECHLRSLSESQAAAGHQVDILTATDRSYPSREEQGSIHIRRCRTWFTVASTPVAPALPPYLLVHKADIIHFHFPYPWADFWIPWTRARGVVLTYHSDILHQTRLLPLYRPFLKRILRRSDRIICTSQNYLKSSLWLQSVQDRCRVIPLGVDLERFHPADRPRNPQLQLLFVGRVRPYKGLDMLLEALESLSGVELTIVGDKVDDVKSTRLRAAARNQSRVRILGAVPDADLPLIYRSADLLLLPSINRSEAFGLVLLEAMASGLPCITTELGTGTSWVVQHGKTGLIVPPGDPARLSQAITQLQENPEQRKAMGLAGRIRAEEHFSQQQMAAQVLKTYEEVLRNSRERG